MTLADTNNDGAYSESELNVLTKPQLLDLCAELGVEGVTSANLKADIITAILNR